MVFIENQIASDSSHKGLKILFLTFLDGIFAVFLVDRWRFIVLQGWQV
jgi:hypothetical protein